MLLEDINEEVIRCVQQENGGQRGLWGLNGGHHAESPKTCLDDVTKTFSGQDAPLLLSSRLPWRLYKPDCCSAAGRDLLLEVLLGKDFV